jgi:ABC-type uncharacterized transport system permease subunit
MKSMSVLVPPGIALMKITSALVRMMSGLMGSMRGLMKYTRKLMDFMNALMISMSAISARMSLLMEINIPLIRADIFPSLLPGASSSPRARGNRN